MYEATVTVFNSYESTTTGQILWFPHVLTGVDLITDKGQMLRRYGPDSTDAAELHVAYSPLSPSWEMVHNYKPALDNMPAVEWASEEERDKHIGEKFYFSDGVRSIVYQFGYDVTKEEWRWKETEKDMKVIVHGWTGEPMLNTMGEPLPWIPPKEWANQVNDLLDDTITFKPDDFFWWGEWTQGTVNDKDYTVTHYASFYDYMRRKHDYVFQITTVGGPYTAIPHFEIRGA